MDIDFVLLWVDGDDPFWTKEKNKYSAETPNNTADDVNGDCRYRGSDELLKFWFRGVEKNAPWVRKIFFISCGQIPTWLNTNHPKLEIVNHKDFVPQEYLPTFNPRPIQFNLHRIKDLSEHFVLFDDDTFLLRPVFPDLFFHNGEPVLPAYLGYLNRGYDHWNRILWNDYGVINTYFNIKKSIWKNRRKWFSIKRIGFSYAIFNFFCFLVNKTLPIYTFGHIAYPHLKSTIDAVWRAIPQEARRTCEKKFRTDDQLNHYLFLAWNQAAGWFSPISVNSIPGLFLSLSPTNMQSICLFIRRKSFPIVCLNDSSNNTDFEQSSACLKESFVACFPEKSAFEK